MVQLLPPQTCFVCRTGVAQEISEDHWTCSNCTREIQGESEVIPRRYEAVCQDGTTRQIVLYFRVPVYRPPPPPVIQSTPKPPAVRPKPAESWINKSLIDELVEEDEYDEERVYRHRHRGDDLSPKDSFNAFEQGVKWEHAFTSRGISANPYADRDQWRKVRFALKHAYQRPYYRESLHLNFGMKSKTRDSRRYFDLCIERYKIALLFGLGILYLVPESPSD